VTKITTNILRIRMKVVFLLPEIFMGHVAEEKIRFF